MIRACDITPRISGLRKGERGVVRGNPLALWRGAVPSILKRLSPVGWFLTKMIPASLDSQPVFVDFDSLLNTDMDNRNSSAKMVSLWQRIEFQRP